MVDMDLVASLVSARNEIHLFCGNLDGEVLQHFPQSPLMHVNILPVWQ